MSSKAAALQKVTHENGSWAIPIDSGKGSFAIVSFTTMHLSVALADWVARSVKERRRRKGQAILNCSNASTALCLYGNASHLERQVLLCSYPLHEKSWARTPPNLAFKICSTLPAWLRTGINWSSSIATCGQNITLNYFVLLSVPGKSIKCDWDRTGLLVSRCSSARISRWQLPV